jgi:hypothetical protein
MKGLTTPLVLPLAKVRFVMILTGKAAGVILPYCPAPVVDPVGVFGTKERRLSG